MNMARRLTAFFESAARSLTVAARPALLCATLACLARAQEAGSIDAIWNDPIFKRQFIAGYGINSEIEPRVTADEVKILETVRPLMAVDLPKAEETLKKVLKPDCSAILDFTLGGIQFQQERMDDALGNYRRAVEKFPSFRRAWRNMGLINTRNGKYEAAISAFTRMIELGGGDAYAFGLLGFAYSAKRDFQPAEASYRNALLLQPDNTEWRLGLTRCVFKQGKFEDAATLLADLITRYPDKAEFWLLQAHSYIGMKQPLIAAQNLEAVDQLGHSTVDSLHTLGDIYMVEGNLMGLAASAYRRAIDLDATQPPARALRSAEGLAASGAFAQAREIAAHIRASWATRLSDGDRGKLLKLEARLSMADGFGSAETARILEEIVALDPLDGDALIQLGQHYARQNEAERAVFYYERAAGIEAFEIAAKTRHGQLLVGLGRYMDALPLLRRAQELKPREDMARYIEQVERIAKSKR